MCFTCSKQIFVFPKLNFTVEPTYETTHNIQNNSHYPIFFSSFSIEEKKKKVADTGLTWQYRFELRDEASNIPHQAAQKLKYWNELHSKDMWCVYLSFQTNSASILDHFSFCSLRYNSSPPDYKTGWIKSHYCRSSLYLQ